MERKRIIDVENEVEHILDEIKHYFTHNADKNTKAVIGISGGKDSTIAAMLCVLALGKERVFGVMMPQGCQKDIADSQEVCKILDIPHCTIDIGNTCENLYNSIDIEKDYFNSCRDYNIVTTNTPARIRMTTLYAIAGMINGRVINTCNYSEIYVGYETKYGDGAGDFSILGDYCVREVLEIGEYVRKKYFSELRSYLITKAPSDGMCGKTDEDNLGFSYAILDKLILDRIIPDYETYRKIEHLRKINEHKRRLNLHTIRNKTRHWNDDKNWNPNRDSFCF